MKYDANNQPVPETIEEYEEIHGKLQFDDEKESDGFLLIDNVLKINVIDCEPCEHEDIVDSSNVFKTNDRGKIDIDYGRFTEVFAEINKVVCCNKQFYTPHGRVSKDYLESEIVKTFYDMKWQGKIDTPTMSVLKTLAGMVYIDELPVNDNVIPFKNGDLHLNKNMWEFRLGEKKQAAYRLSADYIPVEKPTPLFNKWLNDLFYEDDIPVIQEILGYCLIPTTAVQEAFFLVGPGEEGKSIIGHILNSIMGNAIVSVETKDLLTKSFQLSQLEHKLVIYDDDLKSEALSETGLLKKIISADNRLPGEYKFGDPYTFQPYAKLICCTNFMLNSLHDTTHGFFRRLHPIIVKPKGERKAIKNFHEHLISHEKEQIVRWALLGLQRLIKNEWHISWSNRSKEFMGGIQSNRVHFPDFINEVFDKDLAGEVSSADIVKLYTKWCKLNAIIPSKDRTMLKWLGDNTEILQISKSNNIKLNEKKVRGFTGIALKKEWCSDTIF